MTPEPNVEILSRVDGGAAKYTEEELQQAFASAKKVLMSETDGFVVIVTKDDLQGLMRVKGFSPEMIIRIIAESLQMHPLTLLEIARDLMLLQHAEKADTPNQKSPEEANAAPEGPKE